MRDRGGLGLGCVSAERFEPLGEVRVLAHRLGSDTRVILAHGERCLVHAERQRAESARVEDARAGQHLGVAGSRVLGQVAEFAVALDLAVGGERSPASTFVSVVLPAPLRPTRPTLSPSETRNDTSDMRTRAPTRISRSCTASTADVRFVEGEIAAERPATQYIRHDLGDGPGPNVQGGSAEGAPSLHGTLTAGTPPKRRSVTTVTGMAIAVSVEPALIAATPGVPAEVTVTIRNDSTIVEEYSLHATGPGGQYVTLVPDRVSVYPGRIETVTAHVLVPRSASVLAGDLDVAIQVTPTTMPMDDSDADADSARTTAGEVAEFVVTVARFHRGRSRDRPQGLALTRTQAREARDRQQRQRDHGRDPRRHGSRTTCRPPRRARGRHRPRARPVRPTDARPPAPHLARTGSESPVLVLVTPSSGDPIVVDGTHMQEPVFPSWFWKALLALAALIALLILLWNLLLKPTVEDAAREAVAEPLAEVQGQAEAAEKAAAGAQQAAETAAAAAQAGGTATPPPAPPEATATTQNLVFTLTAAQGASVTRGMPEPVPDGSVFQVTDLVFNNPAG